MHDRVCIPCIDHTAFAILLALHYVVSSISDLWRTLVTVPYTVRHTFVCIGGGPPSILIGMVRSESLQNRVKDRDEVDRAHKVRGKE